MSAEEALLTRPDNFTDEEWEKFQRLQTEYRDFRKEEDKPVKKKISTIEEQRRRKSFRELTPTQHFQRIREDVTRMDITEHKLSESRAFLKSLAISLTSYTGILEDLESLRGNQRNITASQVENMRAKANTVNRLIKEASSEQKLKRLTNAAAKLSEAKKTIELLALELEARKAFKYKEREEWKDVEFKPSPREERGGRVPTSLEEVVEQLMRDNSDQWKTGGDSKKNYELMDREGQIIWSHLTGFIREKAAYVIGNQNPQDPALDLFKIQIIPGEQGVQRMTLGDFIGESDRYRKKRMMTIEEVEEKDLDARGKEQKDSEGKIIMKKVYKIGWKNEKNDEYENACSQISLELIDRGNSFVRTADYLPIEGEDKTLVEKQVAMFKRNNLVRIGGATILNIFQLGAMDDDEINEFVEAGGKQTHQGKLGMGMRRVILSLYYLSELVAKENQLSGVNMFFRALNGTEKTDSESREPERLFWKSIIKQCIDNDMIPHTDPEMANLVKIAKEKAGEEKDWIDVLFEKSNRDKLYEKIKYKNKLELKNILKGKDLDKYDDVNQLGSLADWFLKRYRYIDKGVTDLNYFDAKKKPLVIRDILEGAFKEVIQKTDKLNNLDAGYAVRWMFRDFTKWTGLASINDTNAQGFDAWAREVYRQRYTLRQGEWGKGKFGANPLLIPDFKRISLNYFEALNVKPDSPGHTSFDTPLLHVLQGGEGEHVDFSPGSWQMGVFEGNAESEFADNHLRRVFALAETLEGELKLEDFLSIDPRTFDVTFSWEKARTYVASLTGFLRYGLENRGFLYNKKFRVISHYEKDSSGKLIPIYEEKTLFEAMFNIERMQKIFPPLHGETHEQWVKRFVGSGSGNDEMSISMMFFTDIVARELEISRKGLYGRKKLSFQQIDMIRRFFEKVPAKLELDPNTGEIIMPAQFYGPSMWDLISNLADLKSYGRNVAFVQILLSILKTVVGLGKKF